MPISIKLPISETELRSLRMGDSVLISGVMVTGRDAAHKWLMDAFVTGRRQPDEAERKVLERLQAAARGSLLYHCGPVVDKDKDGAYRFVSSGPTTSIREEPYQAAVIELLGLRGVIGKGGMGPKTLEACRRLGAAYFHAVGGAATYIAQSVRKVHDVLRLDLGVPEAIWVIEVEDFPATVTMDAHGDSLHRKIRENSGEILASLIP